MRVAIVGGGFGVSTHLPAFAALPGVTVALVADSGSGAVRAQLPPDVAYAASWKEALSDDIDAVSVVVPPSSQREIVVSALAHGKHVFCDKPFGVSVEDAEAMYSAAADAPACTAAINYQFRYEPGMLELKRQIDTGAVGHLYAIDISWITSGRADPSVPWTWRNDRDSGGGVIGAFFSHVADLVWWLTLSEVRTVFAHSAVLVEHRADRLGQPRRVTAEDMVTAQLQLASGAVISCSISNCQEGGSGMRIEVRGQEGVLVYHHAPPFTQETQSLRFARRGEAKEITLPGPPPSLCDVDSRLWAASRSASDFLKRARGDDSAFPASFADGIRVHRIIAGVRKSIAEGRNVPL